MQIRRRVTRLELLAGPTAASRPGPQSDAEWMAWFQQAREAGMFADEPDFEDALGAGDLIRLLCMARRLAIARG
jgi:hypothetical protein